jgi:tripartite-type tricarboxylate transporter receptor subunit TctC
VTENLAGGAGGTIGATVVAKAVPDGYTLLGALPAAFVAAPALYPNLGYDPARDFLPIASIFRSPQLLTIYPGLLGTKSESALIVPSDPFTYVFGLTAIRNLMQ